MATENAPTTTTSDPNDVVVEVEMLTGIADKTERVPAERRRGPSSEVMRRLFGLAATKPKASTNRDWDLGEPCEPSAGPDLARSHRLTRACESGFGWASAADLEGAFAVAPKAGAPFAGSLFSVDTLYGHVLGGTWDSRALRVLRPGGEVHPADYFAGSPDGRDVAAPRPAASRLSALLDAGCTVVFNDLAAVDPKLAVACRAMQWWSQRPVQVNAYLTTGPTSGFDLHWDDHDVVIFQVAGDKDWEVRGFTRPYPLRRDAEVSLEPPADTLWTGTLQAGDMLYLPRGQWHRAFRSTEGFSLHLTFGFGELTGVNWLEWIADKSREAEVCRRDLPTNSRAADLADADSIVSEFHARAARFPPQRYLTMRQAMARPGPYIYSSAVSPRPDALVCVSAFRPRCQRRGDGLIDVVAAGRRIAIRASAREAIGSFLSGLPVAVDRISREVGFDTRPLANVLLREGLCAEASAELCDAISGLVEDAEPRGTGITTDRLAGSGSAGQSGLDYTISAR